MSLSGKIGSQPLHGLVAATHTPFDATGELNLKVIERQAEHLQGSAIGTVFIGGSTGESQSLTLDERLRLARRWSEVLRGSGLRLVVHVGANCLRDAAALAEQAESLEADAISALAPSYFKPRTLDVLIDSMATIAAAAPATPFYYYDIPQLTGINHSVPDFLERAGGRIPNLAGVKFSGPDLMAYQQALQVQSRQFDVPFGMDECLLAALVLGARGAVGSSYNFAAPIYQRLWLAFASGDLPAARTEQWRSVQLIGKLASFGYMGAAKAVMEMLGVPVGAPRLPNASLDKARQNELGSQLEQLGFFDWIQS
ncbi:MAG: dihydrodipicolinate synthase family protein [Planctomycetota bacterium]|nr:dihydrodipicolinate synthase family protein [Blastopirellula sp.]